MLIKAKDSSPRFALVTAYYKEEKYLLDRCLNSVRAQSIAADHVVVADGVPWLDYIWTVWWRCWSISRASKKCQ